MRMSSGRRWVVGIAAVLILVSTYILQRSNMLIFIGLGDISATSAFILGRVIRMIINDLACIFLIQALFLEQRYVRLAFGIFLIELLVILPIYLAVKLSIEGPTELSSPVLAQVHRMVVNPLLMFLLIGGVFYSRLRENRSNPK